MTTHVGPLVCDSEIDLNILAFQGMLEQIVNVSHLIRNQHVAYSI